MQHFSKSITRKSKWILRSSGISTPRKLNIYQMSNLELISKPGTICAKVKVYDYLNCQTVAAH